MSWKVRHEGSPQAIEGLTLPQVAEGLRDGLWEPTDEVMGPTDDRWQAIENHPALADLAADFEPPPPKVHGDETRLDMNPLIDVALVLLIFFILTTTYDTMRKVLDMPSTTDETVSAGVAVKTREEVERFVVRVEAKGQNGRSVILVEGQPVEEKDLVPALRRHLREQRKTHLLIVATGVDWGTVVTIQDAAKGAGFEKVYLLVPTPG
ncbi:MAG: biopolymer transporter ExbD [Gemmataceae bacterium]|nr:biopolymer transporter ExbD [Gemmataceae bacterium]MDW8266834.1 biopolymer transporter ExbD [Gemmataceae bacterium]